MLNKIDWLANRILFSVYEGISASACFIILVIYWTFRFLFKCIPPYRKNKTRKEEEDFNPIKWMNYKRPPYYNPFNEDYCYTNPEHAFLPLSVLTFFLLNVATIIIGFPLKLLYGHSTLCSISLTIVVSFSSFLLSKYFFERNKRHYSFIPSFTKEPIIIRIAWIIGTYVSIGLLLYIDFQLLDYIYHH